MIISSIYINSKYKVHFLSTDSQTIFDIPKEDVLYEFLSFLWISDLSVKKKVTSHYKAIGLEVTQSHSCLESLLFWKQRDIGTKGHDTVML